MDTIGVVGAEASIPAVQFLIDIVWKDKGCLVHLRAVPLQFALKFLRGPSHRHTAAAVVLALACHYESDLAARIGGNAGRRIFGVPKNIFAAGHQVSDEVSD